jgi:hypothetical protein
MWKSICTLVFALLPLVCHAWGKEGHAAVGAIADANLTAKAKAQVVQLLKNDLNAAGKPSGRKTLASVASWPDEIKSTAEGKADSPWHFRDNPVCSAGNGPCPDGQCIDTKLDAMVEVLRTPTSTTLQKNQALKWVVHLVGDMHQPLHVGENGDRGGNNVQVALQGARTKGRASLHKVWDTDLVVQTMAEAPLTAKLTDGFAAGSTDSWMAQSRKLATDVAYGELPSFACGNPSPSGIVVLPAAYQVAARTAIRAQIEVAGLRLASILNDALK